MRTKTAQKEDWQERRQDGDRDGSPFLAFSKLFTIGRMRDELWALVVKGFWEI